MCITTSDEAINNAVDKIYMTYKLHLSNVLFMCTHLEVPEEKCSGFGILEKLGVKGDILLPSELKLDENNVSVLIEFIMLHI